MPIEGVYVKQVAFVRTGSDTVMIVYIDRDANNCSQPYAFRMLSTDPLYQNTLAQLTLAADNNAPVRIYYDNDPNNCMENGTAAPILGIAFCNPVTGCWNS